MIIKLSDYIMEQSVSTISTDDIYIEQSLAEIDVYTKLIDAYSKSFVMETYVLEAEGSGFGGKVKTFFSNMWEAIKKFFIGIWRAITGIFKKAKTSIADKKAAYSLDSVIKMMEDMSDEEKQAFRIKGNDAKKLYEFSIITESFASIADEISDVCLNFAEEVENSNSAELISERSARVCVQRMEKLYKRFKEDRKKEGYSSFVKLAAADSYSGGKDGNFNDIDYEGALELLKGMREQGVSDKVKLLNEKTAQTFEHLSRSFNQSTNGALGMPELRGMDFINGDKIDDDKVRKATSEPDEERKNNEKQLKKVQARMKMVMDACTRTLNDITLDLKNAVAGYIETCVGIIKTAKGNITKLPDTAFAGEDIDNPPPGIPQMVWDGYTDEQKKRELARRRSSGSDDDERKEHDSNRSAGESTGFAAVYDQLSDDDQDKYDGLTNAQKLAIRKQFKSSGIRSEGDIKKAARALHRELSKY